MMIIKKKEHVTEREKNLVLTREQKKMMEH